MIASKSEQRGTVPGVRETVVIDDGINLLL